MQAWEPFGYQRCVLGVCLAIVLALPADKAVAQAVTQAGSVKQKITLAVNAWTENSSVTVTDEVVSSLSDQAVKALDDIPQRNRQVSRERLESVAARAVVEYLKRSTKTGKSPPLPDLMEQLANRSGALLPAVSDFPTLKIDVAPPEPKDFVVNIDGRDFLGGRSSFRVGASEKSVTVSRSGRMICSFKVTLVPGAVHTQKCPAKT